MAEYRQGSRYRNSRLSEFRNRTTVFPRRIRYDRLTFVGFITIRPGEQFRDDLISLRAFGRDDLGWHIMAANNIDRVADLTVERTLGIPPVAGVIE